MKRYMVWCCCFISLLANPLRLVQAHDLEANRASVVLRDQAHLSISLRIDYANFLHRSFAPQATQTQALLELASMSDHEFERLYQKAQDLLIEQTIISIGERKTLPLKHWRFPKAKQVQQSIRELSAQLIVAPSDHIHSEFFEIQADTVDTENITLCSLKLPPSLGNVLIVHYRAHQQWNEKNAVSLSF